MKLLSFLTLILLLSINYTAKAQNYTLNVPDSLFVCPMDSVIDTINIGSVLGYTDPVNLSLAGLPTGASSSFGTNPVIPADSSSLTIYAGTANSGNYTLTLTANSTSGTQTDSIILVINPPVITPTVTLLSPTAPPLQIIPSPVPLSWTATGTGLTFNMYVATDAAFTNVVDSTIGLTVMVDTAFNDTSATAYQPIIGTTYYWRIVAIDSNAVSSPCGSGNIGIGAATGAFAVGDCSNFSAMVYNGQVFFDQSGIVVCSENAEVYITGGIPPYTYSYGITTGSTSSALLTISEPGNAVPLTITDAQGCTINTTYTVDPIDFSHIGFFNSYHPSCAGACDGSITVNNFSFGGGFLTYDELYYIDPVTGAYTLVGTGVGNFTGLCAGTYVLQSSGGISCNNTQTYNLIDPTPVTSATASTDETCTGNDGTATVTASGGTGSYTYLWNDPSAQTTQTATNLDAGTYTVTVTDFNGCTSTETVVVADDCGCNLSSNTVDILTSCHGACDGSSTLTAAGGTAPYSYAWSNGATTATVSNLCGGAYPVTVTDANGCTVVDTAFILEPLPLIVSSFATPTCANNSTGSIDLSIIPGGTYDYAWSNGTTTEDLSNVTPGTYSVLITDPTSGCTYTHTETVAQVSSLSLSLSVTPPTTSSSNDGYVTVNIMGGTAPYTFSWSNGSSNDTLFNAASGTYDLTVTDANGCVMSQTVVLNPIVSVGLEQEQTTVNELKVIPNPNQGNFALSLELANSQTVSIKIMDILGKTILTEEATGQDLMIPFNLNNLPNGTYLIQVWNDSFLQTEKFILTK